MTNQAVPTEPASDYPHRPSVDDSDPAPGNVPGNVPGNLQVTGPDHSPASGQGKHPDHSSVIHGQGSLENLSRSTEIGLDAAVESADDRAEEAARPLPSRRQIQQRQRLGLVCLLVGYACLGWALQDFGTAPLIWLLVWAGAALWGLELARPWHLLLPALISALALISMVLPVWVLGLLSIPILGFFGCVLIMKEQSLESALMSSLFVYSLSVVAASIGAIGLSLTGGDAPAIAFGVFRVVIGFAFLSLVPTLHRRRFYGLRALKSQRLRLASRYGQFAGISLAGLAAGVGLSRVNWDVVLDFTTQWLN